MDQKECKKIVGYRAAELVEPNMTVGIGTGTTVHYFIEKLNERVKDGLVIQAVFSSKESEKEAAKGGIYPLDNTAEVEIDLTVDGADEIDPKFNMIKGGGGALTREKILAYSSKKMVVIVDQSKYVDVIGNQKLPVEILPFAHGITIHNIQKLGFIGELRKDENYDTYITDNSNFIFDIHLKEPLAHPQTIHQLLINIPGVVETGLFFDVATTLLVGKQDGAIAEYHL